MTWRLDDYPETLRLNSQQIFHNHTDILIKECKDFINEFLNKEKIVFKNFETRDNPIKLFNFKNMNTRTPKKTEEVKNYKEIFFNRNNSPPGLRNTQSEELKIMWNDHDNRKEIIRNLIVLKAARDYNYYNELDSNGISLSFIEFLYFYNHLIKNNPNFYNFIETSKLYNFTKKYHDIEEFFKIKTNETKVSPFNLIKERKDEFKNLNEEFIRYEFSKLFKDNMDNIINSLFEFISEKKEAINDKIKIIKNFIETAGDSGDCLLQRRNKIESDCNDRVKEGYMINRSLADLSKGISKIGSKYSFGKDSFPLYLERQIDSKCRNQFIDYFTFDKYLSESDTIQTIDKDINEYGIILSIIKHYFDVPLDQLFVYTLLVYNTSFFKAPKQNNYKLPSLDIENTGNKQELAKTSINSKNFL